MFKKIKRFLFRNMTTKQTVAKNTFWLTVSNFGGRLVKAGVIIYAARVLGTAGYGVFSYAITLAGFFTLFIDPGINYILMRDISKLDEYQRKELLSTTFIMKIALVILAIIFIVFIAPVFSVLPGAKILLPIAAIMIAIDTFREFFSAFMRSREKMEWDAAAFLTTNLGILIFGFALLAASDAPISLMWGYIAGTTIGMLVAAFAIRNYLREIFAYFSRKLIGPIVQSAWPFAITGALGSLLTSADIFIVSFFRGPSDVGIYSAAIRIVQVLYLVPTVFQFSILPLLARLARTDDARFRAIFERIIAMVFLFSIPLAIGGIILATPIMTFVFGAPYAPGAPSFQLLMATLLFDFPIAIISNAIFAYNHQKNLIISAAIGGITNVVLDIILIPPFGIAGSAVATVIAQAATNWYLWHVMKKLNHFEIAPRLRKVAVASVTMGAVTTVLYFVHAEVLVNIATSIIVYFLALRVLRESLLIEVKRTLFGGAPQAAPINAAG